MATLIHHPGESLHRPGIAGLGGYLRERLARFNVYRRERRNQALILGQLAQADDRELRDLGINRYDFDAIAKGTYRR